ncbi:MAG: trigger factor [Eubacterium sp.]|nr:trigger factor [Eubacterium sp.]
MSKTKKIVIGVLIAIVVVIIAALVAIFKFDVFGMFTSEYKLDYDKYVTVGEYKGLEYDKVKVSVSNAEVKTEIDNRVKAASTTETVKKGTVKDGDTISVNYVGKIDGKEFDGGSAENSSITIGTTSMIDGFTDGLIGAKVGDTVTLNLKFPDDYQAKDVAGKDVVFEVTINSKQITKTPKYDEDFIKNNTDYDSKDAFEKAVKKELLKNKKDEAESQVKNTLWNTVIEKSKVTKYPEKQLEYERQQLISRYKETASSYGVEWEEFLSSYMGMDKKEFRKQVKKYAKTVVKQKLVMYSIAKKEGLKVSKNEYKDYLADLLKNAGFTEEAFQQQYGESIEDYAEENDFKTNLLMDKVLDKVMEYGKAK